MSFTVPMFWDDKLIDCFVALRMWSLKWWIVDLVTQDLVWLTSKVQRPVDLQRLRHGRFYSLPYPPLMLGYKNEDLGPYLTAPSLGG